MEVDQIAFTDLLSNIVDNRGRTCPTADQGTPLIATNCVKDNLLYPAFENIRYVSEKTFHSWFRGHPQPGDIIFVCKGSPGRVCMAPDPVGFCIAQDMVAVRADSTAVDPKYLFAVLRSPQVQHQIANMHVGTLIPHFKKGDFNRLMIPVLGRRVQEFIGSVYFDLSAKIELNRRMSETLEAMARALFKSWFVDFDPVRAKAEGRWKPGQSLPGLPAHLYDLFPNRLVDSELGEIPEGWGEKALDEIADYVNGAACQKYALQEGEDGVPVIKIRELNQGVSEQTDRVHNDFPPENRANDGEVLFSWSGTLLCKVWTGGAGFVNQHVFRVSSDVYPRWFYLYWTQHHLDAFRGVAADKATTMGHIKREHLRNAMVLVPPDDLLNVMTTYVEPLVERQVQVDLESSNLERMRDTLLPKLISGELRVGDAMQPLGGAK